MSMDCSSPALGFYEIAPTYITRRQARLLSRLPLNKR